MQIPKISIITPSYNQGNFIEETIKSVINQNYSNMEYIIIDGGSTDNTIEIIKKYEDKITHWVSENDNGQVDAINKGLKLASGEIITWLNSDDIYLPETINTIMKIFKENIEIDVIYGDYILIFEDGSEYIKKKEIKFDFNTLLFGVNFIGQPSSFFRRNMIVKYGLLKNELNYLMDYEFWLRIASKGAKFYHLKEYLSNYRLHENSKTIAFSEAFSKEKKTIQRSYVDYSDTKLNLLYYYYRVKRQWLKILYRRDLDFYGGPLFKLMYKIKKTKK